MNELSEIKAIPPATNEVHAKFNWLAEMMSKLPQVDTKVTHNLHAGVYSRTCLIPKGVTLVGCQMKCPTMLVQYGHGIFTDGTNVKELHGYQVLEGSALRQCAWTSFEDTWATMYFATNAKTIEEAEAEFCDDPSILLSNKEKNK